MRGNEALADVFDYNLGMQPDVRPPFDGPEVVGAAFARAVGGDPDLFKCDEDKAALSAARDVRTMCGAVPTITAAAFRARAARAARAAGASNPGSFLQYTGTGPRAGGRRLCGNQPVSGARPGSVERRGTGIATPSSRRRVDGVEVDTTIQHRRAVKF